MSAVTQELLDTVEAVLGPGAARVDRSDPSLLEASLSLRWHDALGIQFSYDMRDPYLFTLVWSLTEQHCPVGYRDKDGRDVKVYVQEALRRLGIACDEFTAEMLRLRGSSQNRQAMTDLSVHLLKRHERDLLAGVVRIFPRA